MPGTSGAPFIRRSAHPGRSCSRASIRRLALKAPGGPPGISSPWPRPNPPRPRSQTKTGGVKVRRIKLSVVEFAGEPSNLHAEMKLAKPVKLRENLPGLWRISKYFWPHARQYQALMATSLFALFAEVGLRLMEPWPLKFVFDRILGSGQRNRLSFIPRLDGVDPMIALAVAALAVVAITGLRSVASYWQTIGFAQIGNRVLRKVRSQLYRHVQYLSLSFHSKAKTRDLVMRVISDVGMLQDVVVTALIPTIAKVLIVTSMLSLMLYQHWQLALLDVSVYPPFWLRTITITHRIREVAQKQRRQ